MRHILLSAAAMLILQLLTPFWWWIMVVPFFFGFVNGRSGWRSFRLGMMSAGLLWFFAALYELLTASKIIAMRVAEMLSVGSPWFLLVVTTLIAMLTAGAAGSTGYFLRALLRSPETLSNNKEG